MDANAKSIIHLSMDEIKEDTQIKIPITKGSVQETLLIPLYARKICSERFPLLYRDPAAAKVCRRLDYDFSELDRKTDTLAYEFGALEGALRQLDMMWEIRDYLKTHPNASIVCFGCGLDQDPRRCGTGVNRIYNLDFPDTIAAREELIGTDPREVNIAGDINDHRWMDRIDASKGAIFYAAGVIHYFKKEDVKRLICAMAQRFPGCRFVFDCVNELGFKMMMKLVLKTWNMQDTASYFRTGDPVRELSAWPCGIGVSARDYMRGYYSMKRPGVTSIHRLLARVADGLLGMKIVRVEFPLR